MSRRIDSRRRSILHRKMRTKSSHRASRCCRCSRCAICGSREHVQLHHLGGKHHASHFTIPLCRKTSRSIHSGAAIDGSRSINFGQRGKIAKSTLICPYVSISPGRSSEQVAPTERSAFNASKSLVRSTQERHTNDRPTT